MAHIDSDENAITGATENTFAVLILIIAHVL